jgi:hypothetical protein
MPMAGWCWVGTAAFATYHPLQPWLTSKYSPSFREMHQPQKKIFPVRAPGGTSVAEWKKEVYNERKHN